MTAAHKATAAFAALLALALAFVGHDWHGKAVDLAALDATMKAQKSDQADYAKQSAAVVKQQADLASQLVLVAQDLKARMSALEAQKAAVVTPDQVAIAIQRYLPTSLPAPVTAITAPAPAGSPSGTPPTTTGMVVPGADMKPLFDELVNCRECGAKLTSALGMVSILQDQVKTLQAQVAILQQQVASVTKERDAAVKAAKGGSILTRVKRDAETIAISVGAGFVLAKAGR
jgi:hypothetical protein